MRKIKTVLALVCALAVVVSGTLAYQHGRKVVNEFIGEQEGVTIHDDFDPDTNMKDVYVENTGNVTLFVRVKLDEAMSLTSNTWRPADNEWVTHKYTDNNASYLDCENSSHEGKAFHSNFKWSMGGWKYYKSSDSFNGLAQDTRIYTEQEYNDPASGVKMTQNASIVNSEFYLRGMTADQQKAFIGWIFAPDGYAYWSQPLPKQEATGLLLSGVETLKPPKGTEYYYAINVNVEVVDLKDIPVWRNGADPFDPADKDKKHPEADKDGKDIIDIIIGGDKVITPPDPDGKLPVNKPDAGFTPKTDTDPLKGDGYYAVINFKLYGDPEKNELYHYGYIHLSDVITDGDYNGVTATAIDSKFKPYIKIAECTQHPGEKSIQFSYEPTNDEWKAMGADVNIPVQVLLERGDKSAAVTINMIYPGCLVTISNP
jgi:hypothetical protein